MKRYSNHYTLLSAEDCEPPHGLDLTLGSRDLNKVEKLQECFISQGFDLNKPALIGYPKDGVIQLLSGTHRHEAAKRAGIKLPVSIFPRSIVEAYWGTDKWNDLILDIPVKQLTLMEVGDPVPPPGLDERIDLSEGY